jgi:tRNA-specific 2-thiouridylase
VVLDQPVFGLAKGQIAAFYEDDKLIGGGVIC